MPIITLSLVRSSPGVEPLAIPKSVSSTRPLEVTRMLPGLTARWTKPARWAASRAPATPVPMWIVSSGLEPLLGRRVAGAGSCRRRVGSPAWRPRHGEDVVDPDDVGVAEPGDGDRLAPEAFGDDGSASRLG